MRPTVFASAALLALGLPIATFAAGGGADPPRPAAATPAMPADPAFAQSQGDGRGQRTTPARIPLLQQVVQRNPRNADAYNLLGYRHARLGQSATARCSTISRRWPSIPSISARMNISARPT